MKKDSKAYQKPKLTKHEVDLGVFGTYNDRPDNVQGPTRHSKIVPEER